MKNEFLIFLLTLGIFCSQSLPVSALPYDHKNLPSKSQNISKHSIKKVKKWVNDSKDLFASNRAVITAINIRTFGAFDLNQNDIIDFDLNESSGTFLSAIMGIQDLKMAGVNMIHVLPITPVGKIKALGTAGSLYALNGFNEINPQLVDERISSMSPIEQAKTFIRECHNNNIRVIIDLPCCGSYDYYLKNPNLFEKDKSGNAISPADWTDVRLFKVKNSNGSLNEELYNLHKAFIDMLFEIGADGIRADVATIKPFEFWQRLITYARAKDPQFLFLAEASDSWTTAPCKEGVFTPYNELLDAGFDGYYGSYFKFKDITESSEFANIVNFNIELRKKYANKKSSIGSFMTHDIQSPVLIGGADYAKQLIWLNAVLPVNSYIVDGIMTGDGYLYQYANKHAKQTFTDNTNYYVHPGKFDIFNFSRIPGGLKSDIYTEYVMANRFKKFAINFINNANFKTLKTDNHSVFAYSRTDGTDSMIIILNKDIHSVQKAKIKVPKFSDDMPVTPIKITSIPKNIKSGFDIELVPAEIQIIYIPGISIK